MILAMPSIIQIFLLKAFKWLGDCMPWHRSELSGPIWGYYCDIERLPTLQWTMSIGQCSFWNPLPSVTTIPLSWPLANEFSCFPSSLDCDEPCDSKATAYMMQWTKGAAFPCILDASKSCIARSLCSNSKKSASVCVDYISAAALASHFMDSAEQLIRAFLCNVFAIQFECFY